MPCMLLLSAVDSCRIKFAFLYTSLFILSLKLKLSSGVATVFFLQDDHSDRLKYVVVTVDRLRINVVL